MYKSKSIAPAVLLLALALVGAVALSACGADAVKYVEPSGAKGVLQVIHKVDVPSGSQNYVIDITVANITDKEVGATGEPGGGALKVLIAKKGMLGQPNGGLPTTVDTDRIIGTMKPGRTELIKFHVPKEHNYEYTIEGIQ